MSDKIQEKPRRTKIRNVVESRQQGVVVIENVHDPHNAAAIFRNCDAFGFQRVCLIFENEKPFNPKKLGRSTSSSANKWLNFEIYNSTEACLKQLKSEGYEIIATVLEEDSESLLTAQLPCPKIALLLGNEHRGLSQKAISMADRKIMLPMAGMVQSLNLSVTAGIFLYEVLRQRRLSEECSYGLPEQEKTDLMTHFLSLGKDWFEEESKEGSLIQNDV